MQENSHKPRRWDPIVKLTHWGIVAAIIANAIFTGEGSGWHIWVGYGLAALLVLRLLWGLVGPRNARFSAFPPSPSKAVAHLGEIGRGEVTRHSSHNPLGALMVYAIWGTLLVVIGSGIAMSGPPPADPAAITGHREGSELEAEGGETAGHEHRAPAAVQTSQREEAAETREEEEREEGNGRGEGEEDEALEELHELAVNLLYVLIALHLLGVVFETRRSGREIIGAMLPGGNRQA